MSKRLLWYFIPTFLVSNSCLQQPVQEAVGASSKSNPSPYTVQKACESYTTAYLNALQYNAQKFAKTNPGTKPKINLVQVESHLMSICINYANQASGTALVPQPVEQTPSVLNIVKSTPNTPIQNSPLVQSVIKTGVQHFVTSKVSNAISGNLNFLSSGYGVGAAVSITEGAGVSLSQGNSFELIYQNPPSGAEIGFFCAPSLGFGVGAGINASVETYFVKTLGCSQSKNYEGPVLGFPLSLGGSSLELLLGIDAVEFELFLQDLSKTQWSKSFTIQSIDQEMGRVNSRFLQSLKTSKNPVEVLTIFVYLFFVNSVLSASENFKDAMSKDNTLGIVKTLPQMIESILRQFVSLDALNANNYSSYKVILQNFLNLMTPSTDYIFSRMILEKLIDSLSGCDSISFAPGIMGIDFNFGMIGPSLTYMYSVNPEFTKPDAPYDPTKKTILYLDSFKDFVNPENYVQIAKTTGENLLKTGEDIASGVKSLFLTGESSGSCHQWRLAKQALGTPNERTLLICEDGLNLAIGTDISEYFGLSNLGPLNFLALVANLAEPSYFKSQCLKPTANHFQDVETAIKNFFSH